MNIYLKWFVIVSLNAVVGFFLGFQGSSVALVAGMVAGIFTWYGLYLALDSYLLKRGQKHLSRRLTISAGARAFVQLLYIPDVFAGILAASTLELLGFQGANSDFVTGYLMTILTGLNLSIICGLIFLIVYAVSELRKPTISSKERARNNFHF